MLRDAAATFQRVMDEILASIKWQCPIVYIDEAIIFSKSPQEHVTHIESP